MITKITKWHLVIAFFVFGFSIQAQNIVTTTLCSTSTMCDGTANVNTSMIGPNWSWNQGPNLLQAGGAYIDSLCQGVYELNYLDSTNTNVIVSFTIMANNNPCNGVVIQAGINTLPSNDQVNCNGSLTINAGGGVAPYQFMLNGGPAQNMNNFQNLCPATYTIVVEDINGCNATYTAVVNMDSVNINPCANLNMYTMVVSPTTLNNCTGSIDAVATGGTAPYIFTWPSPLDSTNLATHLCEGPNTVTVTDANGCSLSLSYVVGLDSTNTNPCTTNPIYVNSIVSNTTDPINCNGTINAMVNGGTGPYTFVWSNSVNTNPMITNLCSGVYVVEVTDFNGCYYIDSSYVALDSNANPCANTTLMATITSTNSTDAINCDGTLTVLIGGGIYPYNLTMMNGASTTNQYFSNLCPNYYVITIQDSIGCMISVTGIVGGDSTIVSDPCANSNLFATVSTTNVSGANLCDGEITATVMGGVAPYSFQWNTGATTSTISNLCSDVYTVMINDSNGCIISATGYVGGFIDSTFVMNLNGYVIPTGVSEDGFCDGSASVIIYGGTAPYTYLFSDSSTVSNAYNLCAGLQSVTVTDANGSILVLDFIISTPNNTITNPNNYSDSTLVDSVYNTAISNCIINFFQIDSAYIMNYNVLPNDSIFVTWGVIFGDSTVTITNYYGLGFGSNAGVYMIALQVYCPNKSVGQYLTAYDQIYYNSELAGISEAKNNDFSVYPNPFNEQVVISLDNNKNSEVTISDITGKVVFNKAFTNQLIQIDTRNLSAGQYVITVKNDSSVLTRKIVK